MGAGVLVVGLLYYQGSGSGTDPVQLVRSSDRGWIGLALLAMVASYPVATVGVLGFVPERIGFARTALAQLAGSFVRLVIPGNLGGAALNTRLLQRSGIAPGRAVSSIGAGQLVGLVLHLLQLAFFVWLSGVRRPNTAQGAHSTEIALGCVALVAVLALLVLAVPAVRDRLVTRLRPLLEGSVARLRDLLHHPGGPALGALGQFMVSMMLTSCLYCCVRATGGDARFSAVAVAFLVGSAVGTLVPTPSGVGGVEAATAAVLGSTTGLGNSNALAAVMLFRLITLVLPVLPGWAALSWLQRAEAL
ncbi:lysylphosphatidylglycerol synthase transmembrane domain-containing protein [Kitasatospora nipponensis]|uniref:lysylphosphatidylglycerol synthase transmembrane domain-containing protein n=1 Tax=Kitasatospora nipponensis TaxID=258049 RepID=UPI0031D9C310